MDIVKVRELKKDAEEQINKIISDFINETGTRVKDIDYDIVENIGGDVVGVYTILIVEV